MSSLDEELRLDQEEDIREAQYIYQSLPADLKEKFTTDVILYLMDYIVEFYYESGILESDEDEIDIDLQKVTDGVCQKVKKEDNKDFDPADVFFVVQADLDFQEENL